MKNSLRKHHLGLGAGLIILIILALSGAVLWTERQSAWGRAVQSSRNLLATLSRDLGSDLEILDLSLKSVIRDVADPDLQRLAPELRHQIVFNDLVTADDLVP